MAAPLLRLSQARGLVFRLFYGSIGTNSGTEVRSQPVSWVDRSVRMPKAVRPCA